MKELKQIAKDCGLTSGQESLLYATVLRPQQDDATVLGAWDCIIGALYRRIETLEEEKECLLAEVKALEAAVAGNAARIAKLEAENASFIKDLKLQSIRIAELEIWSDENQGL